MSRRDDVNKLYKITIYLNTIVFGIFVMNVFFSIFATIIINKEISSVFVVLQIFASLTFLLLGTVDDCAFWYEAEKVRRKAAIENALNIDLTEYKTDGYYNNDIAHSLIKYEVNAFESVFFSNNIASEMLWVEGIKALVAFFVFIFSCLYRYEYTLVLVILQALFSSYFIISFISLIAYRIRIKEIYNTFYQELISSEISSEKQIVVLLSNTIEYEAVKAHYKIRLSSKIFNKMNDDLSEKWEAIQKKIKINL